MWGTPDPRQQPLRTETHWPPSAQEHPMCLPSPPTPLRVVPKVQTQPFQAACPAFSEAGTSVGGEECGGCHVNPPLTKRPAAAVCLRRCQRLPAGDDPPDLPASELAASPVRPFSKVTLQVWSGMSVSLPLSCSVLVVLPSCVDLFGSTLSQGASQTSPCGSLLFLFAASVAFYPYLAERSLTAFLLRRPS